MKTKIEAMVYFLPFILVFAYEVFSNFFERKRKRNKYCGIYVQMSNRPQNPY
jgi:hypothetical protein